MTGWSRFPAAGILSAVLTLTAGCGRVQENKEVKEREEVKIPVVFLIDPATNLSNNQEFAEEFNRIYEGQYHMDVEWLTDSASGYREKLKQWNVLDEMPAIITDAGFDYDFYNMLIKNERLADLKPYMEASSSWMESMNPEILKECTEEDGSIYLSPLATGSQAYAGIIYNKELLAKAGYDEFPKTWQELRDCLNALKWRGITPLSLHGSGTYWVPMLLSTAYMEGTKEGKVFLHQDFPDSYQNPEMEKLMETLKGLYSYTYRDALEIDYSEAARRFCQGDAAIFANGYWMFMEMSPEERAKMGFAPFPGNVLMNAPRMTAWAVTEGYSDEVKEGAAKVLEFRIQKDVENTEKLLNRKNLEPLEQDYVEAARNVETIMPNYQMKWEQELQNEFFTENVPEYIKGKLELKEFLRRMDERLEEIQSKK